MPTLNQQPAIDILFKASPLAWRARYQATKAAGGEGGPGANAAPGSGSHRRLDRLLARRNRQT